VSRRCDLTGKGPSFGNTVSHSNRKTRRVRHANVQLRRVYVPELGRRVRLRLSTRAMRTLDKKGLSRFLRDEGLKLGDVT
jgi:large subunit ribosomal protein L28